MPDAPITGAHCRFCGREVEPDEQAPEAWLDAVDTSYLCPTPGLGNDFPDGAQWHEPGGVTREVGSGDVRARRTHARTTGRMLR